MRKIHFAVICLVVLSIGLLLISCGNNYYKPSEKAIVFEYPEDNIASLKSITIDEDEQGSIYVFEFSKDDMFFTEEELKQIVSDYTDDKSWFGSANWSEGDLVDISINSVREYTKKDCIYVLLYLECIDTSIDEIFMGDAEWGILVDIIDSYDAPIITTYRKGIYSEADSIDGEMRSVQSFDDTSGTWSEIYEKFTPSEGIH